MKNNKVVDLINFIENIDKEGKNISKFVTELIVFFKDILLYKNAGIRCDIEDKNNKRGFNKPRNGKNDKKPVAKANTRKRK